MKFYKTLKITFNFGEKTDPLNGNDSEYVHRGIDFRPDNNDLIRAGINGKISKIGYDSRGGLFIQIKSVINDIRFYTNIFHCKSIFVKQGDEVRENEILGLAGATGETTGKHIHYEICTYYRGCNFVQELQEKINNVEIEKEGRIFFDPIKLYDYFKENKYE